MDDVSDLLEATASPPSTPACEPANSSSAGSKSPSDVDALCDLDELSNYRQVPFPVVGSRKVVYRYLGPLPPMKYEFEEENAE